MQAHNIITGKYKHLKSDHSCQVRKINLPMVHKFDVCLVFNHPSFSSNLFIGKGANAALKSQQNVIPVEQDPIISSNISNA